MILLFISVRITAGSSSPISGRELDRAGIDERLRLLDERRELQDGQRELRQRLESLGLDPDVAILIRPDVAGAPGYVMLPADAEPARSDPGQVALDPLDPPANIL